MNGFRLSILLLSLSTTLHANSLDFYYQRYQEKMALPAIHHANIKTYTYQQLIDHQHPELGTFSQRYYVDESYSSGNDSPVFLLLCGERSCEPNVLYTYARDLAKIHHAKLIALEHRYYGKSLPRNSFSTADLQYLTYENALQDIVQFRNDISNDNHWKGKWISFGASYSGLLSAYTREKYPQLFSGAYASSAPVIPMQLFPGYDEHATKILGEKCADMKRQAMHEVENAINDRNRMDEIKTMFNSSEINDNADFLDVLGEVGDFAVQYGFQGTFCDMLQTAATPLQGYAYFTNAVTAMMGIKPVDLTPQAAMSVNPVDYGDIGIRQWFYQVCTEFGAWIIASPNTQKSTRSKFNDTAYYQNVCKRLFEIETMPDVSYTYNHFYLPLLNEDTTNIYFTNGSADPWSRMSLIDENENTGNKNLSYFMIDGASHCSDIMPAYDNDSTSLKEARIRAEALIKQWLR